MSKRTGRPVGRPTKWTKETRAKIIATVAECGFKNVAAASAGVGKSLLNEWIAKGREPNLVAEFVDFVAELEAAEAEFKLRHVRRIDAASEDPKLWKASESILERLDAQEFGRKDRVEVTGPGGGPVEYVVKWDATPEPA